MEITLSPEALQQIGMVVRSVMREEQRSISSVPSPAISALDAVRIRQMAKEAHADGVRRKAEREAKKRKGVANEN